MTLFMLRRIRNCRCYCYCYFHCGSSDNFCYLGHTKNPDDDDDDDDDV